MEPKDILCTDNDLRGTIPHPHLPLKKSRGPTPPAKRSSPVQQGCTEALPTTLGGTYLFFMDHHLLYGNLLRGTYDFSIRLFNSCTIRATVCWCNSLTAISIDATFFVRRLNRSSRSLISWIMP